MRTGFYFSCFEVTSVRQERLSPPGIGLTTSMNGEDGPGRIVVRIVIGDALEKLCGVNIISQMECLHEGSSLFIIMMMMMMMMMLTMMMVKYWLLGRPCWRRTQCCC